MSTRSFHGLGLVIGVTRYNHLSTLPEVSDAQDVADVLSDPARCGYVQVQSLLEAAATRSAIVDALDQLTARVAEVDVTRASVFLYFSGHGGGTRDDDDCYLMPVDARADSAESANATAISGRELSERLRALRAHRVTIALDCCCAAGIAEPKAARGTDPAGVLSARSLEALASGRGRAVLAASRRDGSAYAVPGQRNGIFTRHLLEGLRGAATGTGGVIRVCDLFHHVQQRVCAEMPWQRPVFNAYLEENYPVALYCGGNSPREELPQTKDGHTYDAFVSYRREGTDRSWVEKILVPELERLGIRLCLEHRDFRIGGQRIREIERAIENSRYTISVFTPRYLQGPFQDFQSVLAQHQGIESRAPRFIPLLREECQPSLAVRATEWLDVSDSELDVGVLERLARRLLEDYRTSLTTGGASGPE
jgi:hypothetical protein